MSILLFAISAGWGTLRENGAVADKLMIVNITVIPRSLCNAPGAYNDTLTQEMICVGSMDGNRDSCQGDSGGGLVCGDSVTGIVSFGIGCARPNKPGIYTNVHHYREWIGANSSSAKQPAAFILFGTLMVFLLSFY